MPEKMPRSGRLIRLAEIGACFIAWTCVPAAAGEIVEVAVVKEAIAGEPIRSVHDNHDGRSLLVRSVHDRYFSLRYDSGVSLNQIGLPSTREEPFRDIRRLTPAGEMVLVFDSDVRYVTSARDRWCRFADTNGRKPLGKIVAVECLDGIEACVVVSEHAIGRNSTEQTYQVVGWEFGTGKRLFSFFSRDARLRARWDEDREQCAIFSGGHLWLWDKSDRSLRKRETGSAAVQDLVFEGNTIRTASMLKHNGKAAVSVSSYADGLSEMQELGTWDCPWGSVCSYCGNGEFVAVAMPAADARSFRQRPGDAMTGTLAVFQLQIGLVCEKTNVDWKRTKWMEVTQPMSTLFHMDENWTLRQYALDLK